MNLLHALFPHLRTHSETDEHSFAVNRVIEFGTWVFVAFFVVVCLVFLLLSVGSSAGHAEAAIQLLFVFSIVLCNILLIVLSNPEDGSLWQFVRIEGMVLGAALASDLMLYQHVPLFLTAVFAVALVSVVCVRKCGDSGFLARLTVGLGLFLSFLELLVFVFDHAGPLRAIDVLKVRDLGVLFHIRHLLVALISLLIVVDLLWKIAENIWACTAEAFKRSRLEAVPSNSVIDHVLYLLRLRLNL